MIKIKKIKPLFNAIVTTMNKYEEDETYAGIITKNRAKGAVKEYQTVVAVGTSVRDIKEGDVVKINPIRYAVKKYPENSMKDGIITHNEEIGYNFSVIEMNGVDYLYLRDNDIDYIITEYEETKSKKSDIITPPNKIIIPQTIVTC